MEENEVIGRRDSSTLFATCALAVMLTLAGCHPKPKPVQQPPAPVLAPTASITANPNSIDKGGSVELQWRTNNATSASIDGIGQVDLIGSKTVTPSDSTTYRIVAKGPDGQTGFADVRVTVNTPAAPQPTEQPVSLTDQQWFDQNVKDVYFDYDSYDLNASGQQAVAADAKALAQKPGWKITIQGHCDERGSTEYNLTLGDERATAVKNALVAAGVDASRIQTRSFGKEQPFCTESNDACWQQNRRGHFVLAGH
jgi:peptidoglycan-associated lipoprotein